MRPTLIKSMPSGCPEPRTTAAAFCQPGYVILAALLSLVIEFGLLQAGLAQTASPAAFGRVVLWLGVPLWIGVYTLLRRIPPQHMVAGRIPVFGRILVVMAACLVLPNLRMLFWTRWDIPHDLRPPATLRGVPDMVGTWVGTFSNRDALIAITRQEGTHFDGILLKRHSYWSFKIALRGDVAPDGSVSIYETHALSEPFPRAWAMGQDNGRLNASGDRMAGDGVDTANDRYTWRFSHETNRVVLPRN